MGREPLQVGTGGKQEQNQPWAKSQFLGMGGKQEQGQPWAKSQFLGMGGRSRDSHGQRANFVGTDGKQDQGNRGISALQKGDGQ